MIAGIIQDQDRTFVTKTPILGDLPLVGRFFRGETKERERTELVVMITPKVVADNSQNPFGYQYRPGPEHPMI